MAPQPSPSKPGARTVGARSARRTGEKSSSTDLGMDASGKFGDGGQWTLVKQAAYDAQARALGIDVPDQGAFVAQMFRNMAENTPSESPKPTGSVNSGKKKKNPLLEGLEAYAKTLLGSTKASDATARSQFDTSNALTTSGYDASNLLANTLYDTGNANLTSQYDNILGELLAQKGSADTAATNATNSTISALSALVNPYANMQLASTQSASNPLAAFQAALGYGGDSQTDALASLLSSQNQQANNANYNTGQLASAGWNSMNQAQTTQAGARGTDALTANADAQRLSALQALIARDAGVTANAATRDTALNTNLGTRDAGLTANLGNQNATLNANAATQQGNVNTLMTQLLTLAASGQIDVSSIIKLLGGGKK
jgi:hypothetical protein